MMNLKPFERSFVLLCVIGLLSYFSYNFIRTPVLPLFARELGAAPGLVGLIVSVSTLTGVFVKLPSGILSDILGRKRMLLAGVAIFSIMPFVYIAVKKVWFLIVIRSVHGLATALFAPVAMAVVADQYPTRRGEFLGWYSSSTQIGKLLGPMAGGALAGLLGFPPAFLICGLMGILPLILATIMPVKEPPGRDPAPTGLRQLLLKSREELRGVARDARILVISAMEAVEMIAAGALMAFLPIYGVSVGLSFPQVGLLFGVQGAATLLARPLMGRLSDRWGRRPLIIGGLLVCALTFGAIPAVGSFAGLLLLAGGFGVGEAVVTSSTSALVADLCRTRSLGSAMGVFGTIMDIGHASGPILAGILIGALGYLPAFVAISLLLILGMLLFIVVVR